MMKKLMALGLIASTTLMSGCFLEVEEAIKENIYENSVKSLHLVDVDERVYNGLMVLVDEACEFVKTQGTNCDGMEVFVVSHFEGMPTRIGQAYANSEGAYIAFTKRFIAYSDYEKVRELVYHEVIHVAIARLGLTSLWEMRKGSHHNSHWQAMMVQAGFNPTHGHSEGLKLSYVGGEYVID